MHRYVDSFFFPSKISHDVPRRSRPNIQTQTKVFEPRCIIKKNLTQTQKDLFGLSYMSYDTPVQEVKGSVNPYSEISVCTPGLFMICAAPIGFGGGLGAFHLWKFCVIIGF